MLERAAFAESLHLGVDEPRIDRLYCLVAQPESLDGSRREVLHHDIGFSDHVLDQCKPFRRLQVNGHRALVRIEHVEVIRVVVGLIWSQPPPGIAKSWVLDLHYVGAEPCESFGARRSGFELCEVDDLDALEKGEIHDVVGHVYVPCVR